VLLYLALRKIQLLLNEFSAISALPLKAVGRTYSALVRQAVTPGALWLTRGRGGGRRWGTSPLDMKVCATVTASRFAFR
jgi:hypothetical protein